MTKPDPSSAGEPNPSTSIPPSAGSQETPGLVRDSTSYRIFYPEEAEWIGLHRLKNVVTASEVATILGVNPYKSAFTLYQEKVGNLPGFEGNISTRAGHVLEHFIAELYEEKMDENLVDPGDFTVYCCQDTPWLYCTPDRFTEDINPIAKVVELKALGAYARKDWTNKTGPLEYQVQNQIQLYCTGLEHGALAGLIATREFFVHEFDRHDRLLKNIIPKLAEFRERCMNGDAPPVDGSESTTTALKKIHPKDKGGVVHNDGMEANMHERKILKDELAIVNHKLGLVENQLKQAMGDNAEMWANGVKMTWKWQHKRGGYTKASDSRVLRGPS